MSKNIKNADFLGVLEPIFSFEYNLMIKKLDNEVLKLVRKVQLPKLSVNITNVNYRNFVKTIAGKSIHNSLSIELEAFVEPNTAIKAWNWYRLVNVSPGVIGVPKSYKSDGKLFLTTGRNEPKVTWDILGIWPSDVTMTDASDGTADIFKINMTLQYDDVNGPI